MCPTVRKQPTAVLISRPQSRRTTIPTVLPSMPKATAFPDTSTDRTNSFPTQSTLTGSPKSSKTPLPSHIQRSPEPIPAPRRPQTNNSHSNQPPAKPPVHDSHPTSLNARSENDCGYLHQHRRQFPDSKAVTVRSLISIVTERLLVKSFFQKNKKIPETSPRFPAGNNLPHSSRTPNNAPSDSKSRSPPHHPPA